jgi:hypothetical protein
VPQSVIRKVNTTYSAAATTTRQMDVDAMTNSRPESRCAIKGHVAIDEICRMTFASIALWIFFDWGQARCDGVLSRDVDGGKFSAAKPVTPLLLSRSSAAIPRPFSG